MRKGYKAAAILCAAVTVFTTAFAVPVRAEEAKHQMPNQVITDDKQTWLSYIVTNFFAKTSPGVSFRSSKEDAISLMGITQEDLDAGAYPMMFVDDFKWDSEEKKSIDAFVAGFNGKVISFVDIQMWIHHGIGNWNEQVTSFDEKVQIAFGMNESYYEGGVETKLLDGTKEFAVVGIHDGQVELYTDLDSNLRTVLIETDKFSPYALVYAPTGSIAKYLAEQAGTQTPDGTGNTAETPSDGNTSSELDDVPKTGDIAWEAGFFAVTEKTRRPERALER